MYRCPIHCESRRARYEFTVTRCAPLPGSAFRYSGSVATSVLPSPVAISAILPKWSWMPPMSWTSYGTMFHSSSRPVTLTVVPTRRRARLAHRRERLGQDLVEHFGDRAPQLALDAAACRRRRSARCRSARARPHPPPCASAPCSSATRVSSAPVRSRRMPRNFSVWPRSSSSRDALQAAPRARESHR